MTEQEIAEFDALIGEETARMRVERLELERKNAALQQLLEQKKRNVEEVRAQLARLDAENARIDAEVERVLGHAL